jgi:hypothetical protein
MRWSSILARAGQRRRIRPAHCRQSAVQHLDAAAFSSWQVLPTACATCISCCRRKSSSAWSPTRAGREFGRLSVMLQYRFVMDRLLDVPPEAFNPAAQGALGSGSPDSPASSGIVGARRKRSSLRWSAAFRAAPQDAAQQSAGAGRRGSVWRALGVSPTCRAEELSVDDYIRLANSLK